MISNQKLFSVGDFNFRLQHLLIIGVLILAFSISALIRSTPASYGLELFEFDPFFNYRATNYVLENGFINYFEWIDEKSWHPYGRNVSETSQVTLHLTTATLYKIFGFGTSLYNFTIYFPLIIGSLTVFIIFGFVRVISGTSAGLLAALMFSISVPIFTRGLIGWFKSEPLGLFFAFIALYLFTSGIKFNKGKISFIKLVFGGIFLALGLSAWGGVIFFLIPLIIFFVALPFIRNDNKFLIWAVPTFSFSFIVFSLMFERTSTFTIGYAGIAILLPTIFVIVTQIIQKFSSEKNKIRNCIIVLTAFVASGIAIFSVSSFNPSFRYLHGINPFLKYQDSLTDSVAEHTTSDMTTFFITLSIFIVFGLVGIWILFSKSKIDIKIDMRVFALIIALVGIYVSSVFVRLQLFASIALIIVGSIGIIFLLTKILKSSKSSSIKIIFAGIILMLFIIPVSLPEDRHWISWSDNVPSIKNGGSFYKISTNDWNDAMDWIKNNTAQNAVIAAWWDYGYWISTLADRSTLADNSTLINWQIKKIAYALTTSPENAWHVLNSDSSQDVSKYLGNETILSFGGELPEDFNKKYFEENGEECKQVLMQEVFHSNLDMELDYETCNPIVKGMDADYVVIFVAGERSSIPDSSVFLYTLDGGGDESKKHWIAKIANLELSNIVEEDGMTPTPYFMENTTLGNMIPFSIYKYVEVNTSRAFDEYIPGLIPVYYKDIKFINSEDDPFYLVYASPSFYSEIPGPFQTVLVYKINSEYQK